MPGADSALQRGQRDGLRAAQWATGRASGEQQRGMAGMRSACRARPGHRGTRPC